MLLATVHRAAVDAVFDRSALTVKRIAASDRSLNVTAKQRPAGELTIRHIRLEASPPVDGAPSVILKFDLHNQGSTSLTDIVLSVSVGHAAGESASEPSERVHPFEVKIDNVLLAGYTFGYEIRLRNVSIDTANGPEIAVVDARRIRR
jgi:hypothetical protein